MRFLWHFSVALFFRTQKSIFQSSKCHVERRSTSQVKTCLLIAFSQTSMPWKIVVSDKPRCEFKNKVHVALNSGLTELGIDEILNHQFCAKSFYRLNLFLIFIKFFHNLNFFIAI